MNTESRPTRQAEAAGIAEMLDWLADRPDLPLPVYGSWGIWEGKELAPFGGTAFYVMVESRTRFDSLVDELDRGEAVPWGRYLDHRLQRFGPVAYEVVLAPPVKNDLISIAGPQSAEFDVWSEDEGRAQLLEGLREMFDWLGERDVLDLIPAGPRVRLGDAWDGSSDSLQFEHLVDSEAEQRDLLAVFDRVERRSGQPAYVGPCRRYFGGGVCFAVTVDRH